MHVDTLLFVGGFGIFAIVVVVWAIRHSGDKRPWRGGRYDGTNFTGSSGYFLTGDSSNSASDSGGGSSGGDWGGGGVGGGGDSGGGGGGS